MHIKVKILKPLKCLGCVNLSYADETKACLMGYNPKTCRGYQDE